MSHNLTKKATEKLKAEIIEAKILERSLTRAKNLDKDKKFTAREIMKTKESILGTVFKK